MQEVVSLKQLVGEFRERQAVARFSVEAAFYGILSHHIVYGDVLAYLAGKVEE